MNESQSKIEALVNASACLRSLQHFDTSAVRGISEGIGSALAAFDTSAMRRMSEGIGSAMAAFDTSAMHRMSEGIGSALARLDMTGTNFGARFDNATAIAEMLRESDESAGDAQTDLIDDQEIDSDAPNQTSSSLLVRTFAPSLLVLRKLFSRGVDLSRIRWRDLEELVGELLEFDGYTVQVGRGTKDGGVDVVACKEIPRIGLLTTVWQAKHLKDGNKVELHTIRELADIRAQKKASKGIIVTSGYLTAGALSRIEQDASLLGKVERPELEEWIRRTMASRKR